MTATALDYTWFTGDFPGEYCLTLARALTPEQFLARIGAEVEAVTRDAEGLELLCDGGGDGDPVGVNHRYPIGATAVSGDGGLWTLGVERNGFVGVTEEIIRPASVGTRIVNHFRNVNAADYFHWYDDGEERLFFEPLFAHARWGSEAEAVVEAMRECGFDVRDVEERDFRYHTEAAFALAERLTGVRLTAQVLREPEFLCGMATVPF